MKRLLIVMCALLLAFAAFAAEEDPDEVTTFEPVSYGVNLRANVQEGSGIDNGDSGHDEDPDVIKYKGLNLMVGYNPSDSSYEMGSDWASGQIRGLNQYSSQAPLIVNVVSSTVGSESIQFYVVAAAQTGENVSLNVSFSSTSGFVLEGDSDVTIPITFSYGDVLASPTSAGLGAANDSGYVTVTGYGGSTQTNYVYVARTDASWTTKPDYAAGAYNALITVTVSTN